MALILVLESAAESDNPVSAAAFDASKFFDHMEWDTTFGILREFGMPARAEADGQSCFPLSAFLQARSELWSSVACQQWAHSRMLTHSGGRDGDCYCVGKVCSSLESRGDPGHCD